MNASNDRIENIFQRILHESPSNTLGKGVSDQEILHAENELGINLPESYKNFLKRFGYAYWPEIIYGLEDNLLPSDNIVNANKSERMDVVPQLPIHLAAFSPDGWGNHYCMDTSRWTGDECLIVFWNHEKDEDQNVDITHSSFLEWLSNKIELYKDTD